MPAPHSRDRVHRRFIYASINSGGGRLEGRATSTLTSGASSIRNTRGRLLGEPALCSQAATGFSARAPEAASGSHRGGDGDRARRGALTLLSCRT